MTSFITDPTGLKNRHAVGVENITWESDYPHSDSTWPRSPETLMGELLGVPDDEINAITHENAMRLFRFDPFRHVPKDHATVGALRAQAVDVDLAVKSRGGSSPRDGEGIVTAGQVAKQLATAMTTVD